MRTPCKRLLCLVLCLLMIVSCIPAVGAENGTVSQDDPDDKRIRKTTAMRDGEATQLAYEENNVYYGKTTVLDEDGTYTITLNSFVTGAVTPQPVPMDIVLVVDQSASMVNNAMQETPQTVRFMTNVSGYLYSNLKKQPRLYYDGGDGYYYGATVSRTTNGSGSSIVILNGEEQTVSYSSCSTTVTTASNYKVSLNGWYHYTTKQVRYYLEQDSEKGYYYYSDDIGGGVGYWETAEEAFEYMKTTYRASKYSDYRVVTFNVSGEPHTDITYCLPVSFRWDGTQYTITYTKDGTQQTVVDSCEPWYTTTPSPSDDAAECSVSNLYIYSRNDALQEAAYDFILNIQDIAAEQGVNHRVAVAGFGSGKDYTYPDGSNESSGVAFRGTELLSTTEKITYSENLDKTNYQNAMQPCLDSSTESGRNELLLTAINRIEGKGNTFPNYGLIMAQEILDARTEKTYKVGRRELPRKTIVIVFTDGVPGCYDKLGEFANYDSCGPTATADRAIAEAKKLKDAGAVVYTIGMLDGADPTASYNFGTADRTIGSKTYSCYVEQADAINAFLHFLSSDYPNAADMLTPDRATVVNDGYFYAANSAAALHQAFLNISENVSATTIALTAAAVTRDVMADGFDLPADIAADPSKYIATATLDYLGNEQWAEPVWTNEFPVTVNADTKTVDVTGFDYEGNYVHEAYTDSSGNLIPAGGKRLLILIWGVTANDKAVQNSLVNTNDPSSGIYENGEAAAELVVPFNMPTEHLEKKSFVLDYFASAEIRPEEVGVFTALHLAKDGMGLIPSHIETSQGEDGTVIRTRVYDYCYEVECANGTIELVTLNDGTYRLQYTPSTSDFHAVDSFYLYGADAEGHYVWSKISIVPANNVFYEDDWATYSENWSVVGSDNGNTETLNGAVHGYIDSKANEADYSNGSAHFSDYEYATAEFTFTGTGIDLYCRTDSECGVALAVLNANGETVTSQRLVMDVSSNSGTYYQIPALFFHDLPHGTYTLQLTIRNAVYAGGRDDFYLDGFRVYNPLSTEDEVAQEAYGNEAGADYATLRDLLLSASDATGLIEGAVFIDEIKDEDGNSSSATSSSIQDYKNFGPKNEIYLAPNNSIILKVDAAAHYYLGIKSPTGSATVSYSYGTNDDGEDIRKEVTINSAADLYYEIIPSADGYIEIKNTSESGIISLTKLRTSGAEKGLQLRSASVDEILTYADSFDSLAQAGALSFEAPSFTKRPKQPKPIFRNIQKPITGREQQ